MNHSWIVNSSQPKKARDYGYALALSKNPTSTKATTLSKLKTVGQVLLSEVKNGKVSKSTCLKCLGVGMENISKVRKEALVRTIKLSIKFDGKVVVPPTSIVASTKGEGRSSSQIEANKTATSNKGFNKSSSMKVDNKFKSVSYVQFICLYNPKIFFV